MRKAGIDRNIRMFIFDHSNGNDMDFRYDTINDLDLLTAVDQLEAFLQNVDQNVDQNENNNLVSTDFYNYFRQVSLWLSGIIEVFGGILCKVFIIMVPKGRLELPPVYTD